VARLGLLGGTFNPPHIGHLVCAQEALVQLGLDRVELVPVGIPPHKQIDDEPGVEHRVAMCEAAVADDARLAVSRADVDRDGPAYTVELLRALMARGAGDELTFIVGGDMARSLPQWRAPDEVIALARIAVAERAGAGRAEIADRLAGLAGVRERVDYFEMPRVDVSSSLIRARARAGLPLRYLVPEPVVDYIRRAGLYRGAAPEAGTGPPILG
jgi:nicotinate-nucleotide adenylyltransferase